MPSDPRVRAAIDDLVQTLRTPRDAADTLRVLTHGAVSAIPGADYASISMRRPDGALETIAPTDHIVDALDQHQFELHEGPCYAAATSESFLVTFDLERDPRWPRYGPVAAQVGVHGQLAVVLTDNHSGRSALNIYASQPHEFNHDSIGVAELFASHAAVAMDFAWTMEHMGQAMTGRQVIGQATGIIMERYSLDEDDAFSFLIRVSSQSNVKLRVVAQDIINGVNRRNAKPR
jgi:hypothetical protein